MESPFLPCSADGRIKKSYPSCPGSSSINNNRIIISSSSPAGLKDCDSSVGLEDGSIDLSSPVQAVETSGSKLGYQSLSIILFIPMLSPAPAHLLPLSAPVPVPLPLPLLAPFNWSMDTSGGGGEYMRLGLGVRPRGRLGEGVKDGDEDEELAGGREGR
jgi:hypothetical protein